MLKFSNKCFWLLPRTYLDISVSPFLRQMQLIKLLSPFLFLLTAVLFGVSWCCNLWFGRAWNIAFGCAWVAWLAFVFPWCFFREWSNLSVIITLEHFLGFLRRWWLGRVLVACGMKTPVPPADPILDPLSPRNTTRIYQVLCYNSADWLI